MRVTWTKKEVKELIALWEGGMSIKNIAKMFGTKYSYSSVVGKIYRMQTAGILSKRNKTKKKKGIMSKQTKKKLTKTIKEIPNAPLKEPKVVPLTTKSVQEKYGKVDWVAGKIPDWYVNPKTNPTMKALDRGESAQKIVAAIADLQKFLLHKNQQYGDSALNPIRIFSQADQCEQIKVRIDDKLNRLVQGSATLESDEDVIKDLIGYLILLLIHLQEQ